MVKIVSEIDSNATKKLEGDSNGILVLNIDSNGSNASKKIDSNGRQLNCQSTSDQNDHMNYMGDLFNVKLALKPVVSRGLMLSKDYIDSNGECSVGGVSMIDDTKCIDLSGSQKDRDKKNVENIDKNVIIDNELQGDAKEVDNCVSNEVVLPANMNIEASHDNHKKVSDMQRHLSADLVYADQKLTVCKSLSSSSPKTSKVKNVVGILETSSSKRLKQAPIQKSQAGIKPFLCLKGKIGGERGSPKVKIKQKVKDKINEFESKAKALKDTVEKDKKLEVELQRNKIKKLVEVFENGKAPKVVHATKVVHAPVKVENKEDIKYFDVEKDNSEIQNAFKILMQSGGGNHPKKTPGKAMKRLGKSSARKLEAKLKK